MTGLASAAMLTEIGHELLERVEELNRARTSAADLPLEYGPHLEAMEPSQLVAYRLLITRYLIEQRRLEPPDLALAEQLAELRAGAGIPFESFLEATVGSMAMLWDQILASARRRRAGDAALDVAAQILDDLHLLVARAVAAYRRIDAARIDEERERRVRFVHDLVFGLGVGNTAQFGIPSDWLCRPLRAGMSDGADLHALERRIHQQASVSSQPAITAFIAGDLVALVTGRPNLDDIDVAVGIGPPARLDLLASSFASASRALATARAFELSGVFALEDLAVRSAILADHDVGDAVVTRCLAPLEPLGDFGATIAATVDAYLTKSLNLEATARNLAVHVNTVRHRLQRYCAATGLDLENFADLVAIWWALQRHVLAEYART